MEIYLMVSVCSHVSCPLLKKSCFSNIFFPIQILMPLSADNIWRADNIGLPYLEYSYFKKGAYIKGKTVIKNIMSPNLWKAELSGFFLARKQHSEFASRCLRGANVSVILLVLTIILFDIWQQCDLKWNRDKQTWKKVKSERSVLYF